MLKRQRRTFKIIKILVISFFVLIVLVYTMPFAKELSEVDPRAYNKAKVLMSSDLVTNKKVKIYVGHTPLMYLYASAFAEPGLSRFFIRKSLLVNDYLDVIMAHELGRIEVSFKEDEADLFAAKLVGRDRFIDYLKYGEKRRNERGRLSYLRTNSLYIGLLAILIDPFSSKKIEQLIDKINNEFK